MNPESIAVFVPIIIFMIPIIAILTAHQRKMAEIVHGNRDNNQNLSPHYATQQDLAMMREEMRQMRELIHNQTLAIDNLADRKLVDQLSNRLEQ
jgi:hypothetical protein